MLEEKALATLISAIADIKTYFKATVMKNMILAEE